MHFMPRIEPQHVSILLVVYACYYLLIFGGGGGSEGNYNAPFPSVCNPGYEDCFEAMN